MKLFIKGFIIGIAKVLPGISGALIAIRLNVYNKLVLTITSFFSNIKENSLFLIKIGLGFIVSVIITSKFLYSFIESYFFLFKLLFFILIISGLPSTLKKASSKLAIFIITILFYILLCFCDLYLSECNINYFVAGMVELVSTIIPGISGTAIYINLGWYDEILQMFGNLYLLEFWKIIPFGLGIIISMVILTKTIENMILKHEKIFYSFISAFVIVSLIMLFK